MPRSLTSLPGPARLPLVGNLPALIDSPLGFLVDNTAAHGDLWRFRIGRQETVVVSDPTLIEDVFVTHRKATIKDPITAGLSDVLGHGLLTAEGETWRQNRRLIAPSFQPRHLADLGETMIASTVTAADGLADGEHDLHGEMMGLTLDIAVRTLFGTVLEDTARIGPLVEELMHGFDKKTHTWRRLLPDWLPTPNRAMARRNQAELHAVLRASWPRSGPRTTGARTCSPGCWRPGTTTAAAWTTPSCATRC